MFPVPNLFWAGNPKLKWTQYSFPTNDEGGHSLIFAKLVGTCQVCNGDQGVMGFNLAHMSRNMSGPVGSMMICEEKILVKSLSNCTYPSSDHVMFTNYGGRVWIMGKGGSITWWYLTTMWRFGKSVLWRWQAITIGHGDSLAKLIWAF